MIEQCNDDSFLCFFVCFTVSSRAYLNVKSQCRAKSMCYWKCVGITQMCYKCRRHLLSSAISSHASRASISTSTYRDKL